MTPGDDDDDSEHHDPIEPEAGERPTVDAGSPRAVRKRQTKFQILQREEDRFWQGIFADEVGRRCMWKLLSSAHPFEPSFACGPNGFPQPEATWFKAGEQALGLRIYQTWLEKFPLEVIQMQREHDPRFAGKKKDE